MSSAPVSAAQLVLVRSMKFNLVRLALLIPTSFTRAETPSVIIGQLTSEIHAGKLDWFNQSSFDATTVKSLGVG